MSEDNSEHKKVGCFLGFWFGGVAFFVSFLFDLDFYLRILIAIGVGIVYYFLFKAVSKKMGREQASMTSETPESGEHFIRMKCRACSYSYYAPGGKPGARRCPKCDKDEVVVEVEEVV